MHELQGKRRGAPWRVESTGLESAKESGLYGETLRTHWKV